VAEICWPTEQVLVPVEFIPPVAREINNPPRNAKVREVQAMRASVIVDLDGTFAFPGGRRTSGTQVVIMRLTL